MKVAFHMATTPLCHAFSAAFTSPLRENLSKIDALHTARHPSKHLIGNRLKQT